MSGRHLSLSVPESAPSGRNIVVTLLLVLVLGASGTAVALGIRGGSADAGSGCRRFLTLNVLTTPAMSAPIGLAADDWLSTQPRVGDRCLRVSVRTAPDVTAEAGLLIPAPGGPTVWIPDSTLWSQRLTTDLSESPIPSVATAVYPGVASSPVVIAAPPSRAAHLSSLDAPALARAALDATLPITALDPLTRSEGVFSLLALRSVLPSSTGSPASNRPSRELVALMTRLSHSSYASPESGFSDLTHGRTVLFAASEQAVAAQNRSAGRPVVGAVYSKSGSFLLDYPVVRLSRSGDDPGLAGAVDQFQRALRRTSSLTRLHAAGFRGPGGAPITAVGGFGSAAVVARPAPATAVVGDILRLWSAAKASSHTLAVMDVSGSMAEGAGNGRTKIALAAAAAARAVGYFPDDSAFGLWSFSSNRTGRLPWSVLAPVVPLGSTDPAPGQGSGAGSGAGSTTQRERLLDAAAQLPGLVGGSTALYDTTLAAFQQMRNTYDPAKVNSVVILTDGQNDYPPGISLESLLSHLRLLVDASRPVPIITVGIGSRADLPVLRQISAVTGGKTYAVTDPSDVGNVFLDAVLQRQCRPSC